MTFSLDADRRAAAVSRIVAEYPDEATDAEWLGTYWSEVLEDAEREAFGEFGDFQEAVTQAVMAAE